LADRPTGDLFSVLVLALFFSQILCSDVLCRKSLLTAVAAVRVEGDSLYLSLEVQKIIAECQLEARYTLPVVHGF